MTRLVLERRFEVPLSRQDVLDMAKSGAWCFRQYRVAWLGSMLSLDGRSMVCQFEAGDAESIRLALRMLDTDMRVMWPATVHEAGEPGHPSVLVERSFNAPCDLEQLQAQENSKQWCLDTHKVRFVRTLLSRDARRMLCLYSGPDADAVRTAQRQAGMPLDRVWSFQALGLTDVGA